MKTILLPHEDLSGLLSPLVLDALDRNRTDDAGNPVDPISPKAVARHEDATTLALDFAKAADATAFLKALDAAGIKDVAVVATAEEPAPVTEEPAAPAE